MQLWHPDTLLFDSSPQKYPSFSISGYTFEKLNLEAKCPHDNFSCLLLENKNSLLCKMSTPISRFPAVLFPSDIDFLSLHLWGEEGKRIMIFWKVILKKNLFINVVYTLCLSASCFMRSDSEWKSPACTTLQDLLSARWSISYRSHLFSAASRYLQVKFLVPVSKVSVAWSLKA